MLCCLCEPPPTSVDYVSPDEGIPSDARPQSKPPRLRSVALLPVLGLAPQRVLSEHTSLAHQPSAAHGPLKTQDVQTLSDGVDPTYEAWSI
jgi:hypothetical protein